MREGGGSADVRERARPDIKNVGDPISPLPDVMVRERAAGPSARCNLITDTRVQPPFVFFSS